ncbi:MAG: head-tail connector protein [Desulfovibrionaceae bacterium]|nr:head-tail connector protein [Desulfovibrionaceae bacterium]
MAAAELVERVLARLGAMDEARSQWLGTWRELSGYFMPRRAGFQGPASGAGDENIYDSTPRNALELLASAMGGLLTNPALPWFDIRLGAGSEGDGQQVRDYLEKCRQAMISVFNSEDTGFQAHAHEIYLDLALFGIGVMYVEADEASVVRFSTRPLGEVFVSESAGGVVDTVLRKYELTARQAFQEWGQDCSGELKARFRDRPEDKVEIVHAVFPRQDRDPMGFGSANFPFASLYLETRAGHLLEESGYLEMPYMAPRWSKAAGEVYGRGPGLTALSDTRVLNAMARTALMASEKMADPPLMVPDDGFLGPVRSGPGGLSYYRAGSTDRIEALPISADLGAAERMMEQRRASIRRIFMADQLAPDSGPAMSATEALIRQSEKVRVLGPVLGRMQTEFLCPLVKRVFRIMLRAGRLPEPPAGVEAGDMTVVYSSPLARAQRQYEAQGLMQAMDYLSPFMARGDELGVVDNFDTDRIARHAAELFGMPADHVRPVEAVAELRLSRAAGQAGGRP